MVEKNMGSKFCVDGRYNAPVFLKDENIGRGVNRGVIKKAYVGILKECIKQFLFATF
jgi:hypothetical protein